ncbi:RNA 3'-terminal phosphate cyclase [Salmonella enterica subsp. enterica serovar Enteritidis]|nr:RNA 3'-terminal phosphate cyclase [Salmonella enterica subsp. enterica serovar Enteritidis]EEE4962246.1 RNA 3'-terminal phosphate cyclase [Salmonella enterica subsp. enterica serovar Enteritidis]EEM4380407.1 RNA 3'-terminal phosphate cyclase [Salmonella enterica subsp. enterica serovar Enteritidis]EHH1992271.1 RNA 3'-terminal phosphate cyclase [Salmonella enterica subsp. enterica serovar Enteritidis]
MNYELMTTQNAPVKMWTKGVPVEDDARQQLINTAKMPFIFKHIAVMPDVHLGKGSTIGSVIPTKGAIIPAAVGVDIGCGMNALRTSLTAADLPENLAELRSAIEAAVPHGRTTGRGRRDVGAWGNPPANVDEKWAQLEAGYQWLTQKYPRFLNTNSYKHLGTLGTGNHFIEICLDETDRVWIMLHSGSRGIGNAIGTYFIGLAQQEMQEQLETLPSRDLAYFNEGSEYFDDYLKAVHWAQQFASLNREAMMENALDGAQGEGGGQILRSALSLSMITGQPFEMSDIRAGRAKPGLLRQHLTAVRAATEICGAQVNGDELGSQQLRFTPGPIRGGEYRFAIGSAGSCMLVLQTVLPALWFADGSSRVEVHGGTHNQAAPSADFICRVWEPLLARMGISQRTTLIKHGFYPAGGGAAATVVEPATSLRGLTLISRGETLRTTAEALLAAVPYHVGEREVATLEAHFPLAEKNVVALEGGCGPGNALLLMIQSEQLTELFAAFGVKGTSAEAVANQVAHEARRYLASPAAVGEHLADQLILPLALAGEGAFTVARASAHLLTNIAVVERFLPVRFSCEATESGYLVRVSD